MRLLLVAAACLFLIASPAVGQQHGEPANGEQKSAQEKSKAAISAVKAESAKQNENQSESQPSKRPPFWDIYWPTVGLVILGFLGTFIAIRTLRDLKRQTDAAVDSAKAAKFNAEAIINTERAWLFADIEKSPSSGRIIQNGLSTSISIRIVCRNVGHGPAWITQVRTTFEATRILPMEPSLNGCEIIHAEPVPIAPSDDPFVTRDCTFSVDAIQGIGGGPSDPELFVVYGVVFYRDSFSENRQTTFGYRLLPGNDVRFERFSGRPKYNETT